MVLLLLLALCADVYDVVAGDVAAAGDEQLLVRFSTGRSTAHGQWVILSTYRWVRPHPPEPQSQRRMLQHNAIEAWQNMQKVGWRRCRPPVR